jgi:glycolate oxidase iron-sulfur subunit
MSSDLRSPEERAALVDYVASLDCIHCGLCLQTCPTFRLTGVESSSPRGRIHLMRAVAENRTEPDATFAEEMDFCLLCRHCESVCPAGVHFGAMMEKTRGALEAGRPGLLRRLARHVGFRWLLPSRLALRLTGSLLRLAQLLGLDRLADRLAPGRGLAHLPRIEPLSARRLLPRYTPSTGPAQRGDVLFLEGCVVPELHARVNRAAVRVLTRLGHGVRVPHPLTCCGSLHAHNGDRPGARALARKVIESVEAQAGQDGQLPLLVNASAGCGAHLRELAHLFEPGDPWYARAAAVAARVADLSEVVAPALSERDAPLGLPDLPAPLTWDDPCHLCHAQGIRSQPRAVLDALPGPERVELEGSESCCGSAGIYSLLRPADSQAVFASKRAALERSGARTLVTANPGCQLQWESGLARAGSDVRVLHLAEVLDAALRAGEPRA